MRCRSGTGGCSCSRSRSSAGRRWRWRRTCPVHRRPVCGAAVQAHALSELRDVRLTGGGTWCSTSTTSTNPVRRFERDVKRLAARPAIAVGTTSSAPGPAASGCRNSASGLSDGSKQRGHACRRHLGRAWTWDKRQLVLDEENAPGRGAPGRWRRGRAGPRLGGRVLFVTPDQVVTAPGRARLADGAGYERGVRQGGPCRYCDGMGWPVGKARPRALPGVRRDVGHRLPGVAGAAGARPASSADCPDSRDCPAASRSFVHRFPPSSLARSLLPGLSARVTEGGACCCRR